MAGVEPEDAGAASRLVNVAHQLGGSLGLGLLVAVFAAAGSVTLHGLDLLAHRIGAALAAGAAILALALAVVVALIVRPWERGRVAGDDSAGRDTCAMGLVGSRSVGRGRP